MASITDRLGIEPWASGDEMLQALLDRIEALEESRSRMRKQIAVLEERAALALLEDQATGL